MSTLTPATQVPWAVSSPFRMRPGLARLAAGGHAIGMSWAYYVGIAAIAAHLAWQLKVFDIQRPDRNFMLFRANLWLGAILVAAALAGTLIA